MAKDFPLTPNVSTDNAVAMVINDRVYEVMLCNDYTRDLYLSNPTFVLVEQGQVDIGYTYDGTSFTYGEITFPDPE